MQTVEKGKETIKGLVANYGPVGPRHLLAAALLMHPRQEPESEAQKAEKARLAEMIAA